MTWRGWVVSRLQRASLIKLYVVVRVVVVLAEIASCILGLIRRALRHIKFMTAIFI